MTVLINENQVGGKMNSLANQLLERIANGEKMTLRDMCIALGWQGGTIHQVAKELNLDIITLLDAQK